MKNTKDTLRARGANWTESEKSILVEEVLKREHIIFGKFAGCGSSGGVTVRDKEESWTSVLQAVNSSAITKKSVEQCRKQFHNIKQRVKERHDDARYPKTGGGPPMTSPSPSQKLLWEGMGNRAGARGITLPIDSEDIEDLVDNQYQQDLLSRSPLLAEAAGLSVVPVVAACTVSGPCGATSHKDMENPPPVKRAKRRTNSCQNIEVEVELLLLEKERAEAEKQKLDLECNLLKIQMKNEKEKHEKEMACLKFEMLENYSLLTDVLN
ncbi:uncharacterized protein LOC110451787 [Mizuhopecten yessoensis]|uniref:uncharacterized protein LOC110451787 n=1 Tax=Mizuhopecten yessoensis TaxID=6573 RepID=UPI000B459F4F|nr:uncharacterized protein LOC110451787 [Mizuhopecten yessoensis]